MSEDVKHRILEGALKLFATNGIKGITMDEIAETLSMSKRTIYENFKDKSTLVLECVKHMNQAINERNKQISRESDNIIIETMRCMHEALKDIRNTSPKFLKEVKALDFPNDYVAQMKLERLIKQEMKLQRGQEEGYIRPELSTRIVSNTMNEGIRTTIELTVSENPDMPIYKVIDTTVKIFMRGICTEKGLKIIDDYEKANPVA